MVLTRRAFKISLKIASLLLWLVGVCIGVSGAFLLFKYTTNGVFFGSFFIILPAMLAVVSGVLLCSAAGCAVSCKEPSSLQALLDVDLAPLKDVFQNYSVNSKDPDTNSVNSLQHVGVYTDISRHGSILDQCGTANEI